MLEVAREGSIGEVKVLEAELHAECEAREELAAECFTLVERVMKLTKRAEEAEGEVERLLSAQAQHKAAPEVLEVPEVPVVVVVVESEKDKEDREEGKDVIMTRSNMNDMNVVPELLEAQKELLEALRWEKGNSLASSAVSPLSQKEGAREVSEEAISPFRSVHMSHLRQNVGDSPLKEVEEAISPFRSDMSHLRQNVAKAARRLAALALPSEDEGAKDDMVELLSALTEQQNVGDSPLKEVEEAGEAMREELITVRIELEERCKERDEASSRACRELQQCQEAMETGEFVAKRLQGELLSKEEALVEMTRVKESKEEALVEMTRVKEAYEGEVVGMKEENTRLEGEVVGMKEENTRLEGEVVALEEKSMELRANVELVSEAVEAEKQEEKTREERERGSMEARLEAEMMKARRAVESEAEAKRLLKEVEEVVPLLTEAKFEAEKARDELKASLEKERKLKEEALEAQRVAEDVVLSMREKELQLKQLEAESRRGLDSISTAQAAARELHLEEKTAYEARLQASESELSMMTTALAAAKTKEEAVEKQYLEVSGLLTTQTEEMEERLKEENCLKEEAAEELQGALEEAAREKRLREEAERELVAVKRAAVSEVAIFVNESEEAKEALKRLEVGMEEKQSRLEELQQKAEESQKENQKENIMVESMATVSMESWNSGLQEKILKKTQAHLKEMMSRREGGGTFSERVRQQMLGKEPQYNSPGLEQVPRKVPPVRRNLR